jgi:hypothetical protein
MGARLRLAPMGRGGPSHGPKGKGGLLFHKETAPLDRSPFSSNFHVGKNYWVKARSLEPAALSSLDPEKPEQA